MTPMEARLQCLRLAVDTTGNPNKLLLAQGYYEFVNTPEPVRNDRSGKPSREGKGN